MRWRTMAEKSAMQALVGVLIDFWRRGVACPTIRDIFRRLRELRVKFRERRVCNVISEARRQMEKQFDIVPYSLGANYYRSEKDGKGRVIRRSFKDDPPRDMVEGKRCLAGGRSNKIVGLYFADKAKRESRMDFIVMAAVARQNRIGALLQSRAAERTQLAIKAKQATPEAALRLLTVSMNEATLKHMTPMLQRLLKSQAETAAIMGDLMDKEKELIKEREALKVERRQEAASGGP